MDRPMRRWVKSWKVQNPNYDLRFFDDADCLDFVTRCHPRHLATYLALTAVERTDLWRYLVILTNGGFYTDADTICKRPLSDWVHSEDQAIIGIDGDYLDKFPSWQPQGLVRSGGAYNFDLWWHDNIVAFSNWTFAACPGHPILAEVIRRIEINVTDPFFVERAPDWTIKKTGPGVLTDVLYDWLHDRGCRAEDIVRDLRQKRAVVIDGVRFVDRPAFHWREVRHFGMGSWKPPSIVVKWRKFSRYWS